MYNIKVSAFDDDYIRSIRAKDEARSKYVEYEIRSNKYEYGEKRRAATKLYRKKRNLK